MTQTIGAGMARTFLQHVTARGLPRAALLATAGLREADLAAHDDRVPLDRYLALVAAAERAAGDPLLILDYAADVQAMETSIVCVIGSTCETMADAHAHLNRYARLTLDVGTRHGGVHFPLEPTRDGLWLVDDRDLPLEARQVSEASLLRMASGTRAVQPSPSLLRAVHFRHAPGGPAERYEAAFGAPVRFGQARTGLLLDPAWPRLRVRRTPHYVSDVLQAHAARLLESLDRSRTTHGRVETELRARLGRGDVGMDAVARALAMSRQTLYRALRADGVTFEAVLDGVRRTVAIEALSVEGAPVGVAARRSGFSDPAAFSRAFRRWTGASPRAYRAARPSAA